MYACVDAGYMPQSACGLGSRMTRATRLLSGLLNVLMCLGIEGFFLSIHHRIDGLW
jgi:hypothetical protein